MAQVTMHPQVQTDEVFSGVDCFEITTSDTVNFTYQVRAVYVGLGGDPVLTQLLQSILIGSQRSVYRVALFETLPQARDWLQGEMRSAWRSGLPTRSSAS